MTFVKTEVLNVHPYKYYAKVLYLKAFPWRMGEKDIKIIKMLCRMSTKKAAERLRMDERAVNQQLQRIKIRKVRYRWWMNNVLLAERTSQRLKKRLILPEELKEEQEIREIETEESW